MFRVLSGGVGKVRQGVWACSRTIWQEDRGRERGHAGLQAQRHVWQAGEVVRMERAYMLLRRAHQTCGGRCVCVCAV